MEEEDENVEVERKQVVEEPTPRRRAKVLFIPKRTPSVVIPPKKKIYITPDKTTCATCVCFPKEDPYRKPKKLHPCQKSPELLYELAARVVDRLLFPAAFKWTEEEVADWMADVVGLPEYRECMLDNHINGLRLIRLEDPSHLPPINIRDFDHIKISQKISTTQIINCSNGTFLNGRSPEPRSLLSRMHHEQMITSKVKQLYSTEYIRFARSIGLPPRKPLTHCTLFKSRTGPTWGIRQNWTRCDILRWMKILNPEPLHLDHWDLVWYTKPEFPYQKFARLAKRESEVEVPLYVSREDVCNEYTVPRKFRIQRGIPEEAQLIWMEHLPGSFSLLPTPPVIVKPRGTIPKKSRLDPPKVSVKGLKGKNLVLARRRMPTPKFTPLNLY